MLLIAGDGTEFDLVKAKADEINLRHDREVVRCLGFVLDIPSLHVAADIVLGMSRAALEAMAMAKPVVIFGPQGAFGPVSPDNIDILEKETTSRWMPLSTHRRDTVQICRRSNPGSRQMRPPRRVWAASRDRTPL